MMNAYDRYFIFTKTTYILLHKKHKMRTLAKKSETRVAFMENRNNLSENSALNAKTNTLP